MSRTYLTRRPVKKVLKELIAEFSLKNYEVKIQSDDGGTVINVYVPNHTDASVLRNIIPLHYELYRVTVTYDTITNPVYAPDDNSTVDDGEYY